MCIRDRPGVDHVARQRKRFGSGAFFGTDAVIPLNALPYDLRNVGEGLHIVENGGHGPQAVFDGAGRLYAGHSAVALD